MSARFSICERVAEDFDREDSKVFAEIAVNAVQRRARALRASDCAGTLRRLARESRAKGKASKGVFLSGPLRAGLTSAAPAGWFFDGLKTVAALRADRSVDGPPTQEIFYLAKRYAPEVVWWQSKRDPSSRKALLWMTANGRLGGRTGG